MKITIPSIRDQQKYIFKEATKQSIVELKENLKAPVFNIPVDIDESNYPTTHLLREREGWQAPDPEIVRAYFSQFQSAFDEYNTDKKLADLLGLSSNRRIREFKSGEYKVPYGIWRRFLVLTGRAPQEIIRVLGFF